MASVVDDPGGRRRILFVAPNESRKTIRLGKIDRNNVDALTALINEVVEVPSRVAAQKQVVLEVDLPAELRLDVDERRMRQVVDNLVSNAVKYTEAGGTVCVTLRTTDQGAEITVADTGIGIAEDEVSRVFSRFFRGSIAVDKHIPGTGLGLNIVASIVRAHGGTVSVDSKSGRGSTFYVTLPIQEA